MYKQPLVVCLLELLLAWLACAAAKDELASQLPLERDAPLLGSLLVDDGVVMLEVGTEAFGLERDPQRVLVHSVGVLRPVAEVVGVERELLAEVLDGLRVLVEENLVGQC